LPGAAKYFLQARPSFERKGELFIENENVEVEGGSVKAGFRADKSEPNIHYRETMEDGRSAGAAGYSPDAARRTPALTDARGRPGFPTLNAIIGALRTTLKFRLNPSRIGQPSWFEPPDDKPDAEPGFFVDG